MYSGPSRADCSDFSVFLVDVLLPLHTLPCHFAQATHLQQQAQSLQVKIQNKLPYGLNTKQFQLMMRDMNITANNLISSVPSNPCA